MIEHAKLKGESQDVKEKLDCNLFPTRSEGNLKKPVRSGKAVFLYF
jgi:hypothetical protein